MLSRLQQRYLFSISNHCPTILIVMCVPIVPALHGVKHCQRYIKGQGPSLDKCIRLVTKVMTSYSGPLKGNQKQGTALCSC